MDKLSKVNCKYGAPLGRQNLIPNPNATVKLHMVKLRWVDGDYSEDGTYWGQTKGEHIYWARGEYYEEGLSQNVDYCVFVRAKSRVEAKELVRESVPNARFFK